MNYLCKRFNCFPNDPKIQEMDDIMRLWYHASWQEDENEEMKKMKNFACFVGSFWNAEMAKKIQDGDNNKHEMNDEEFDKASEYVRLETLKAIEEAGKKKKRKRKIVLKNKR